MHCPLIHCIATPPDTAEASLCETFTFSCVFVRSDYDEDFDGSSLFSSPSDVTDCTVNGITSAPHSA